ncbi:hypothetical protein B0A54_15482 [Friedmanniomyces endolithicus]|uniref:mRNA decay factor PAT1 domain-containing protein n=1 Tax=Friedmanniomyces endolithicus TaxID=329885 RepID=A0A4U0UBF4_9PEZI|nr:hypothetical protein B0A54_15482 [Friedmanniomyces endolithicus]
MSFFGFDTTLPRDRPPPPSGRGMFDQHDPFAGLGRGVSAAGDEDEDEALNFEETYDGLGQQLAESGDTFNDDTFGGDEPVTRQSVGRDFDFAGQTAQARDTLREEQGLPPARQPQSYAQAPRPPRTGYEAYKQPGGMPKLEADASIWGQPMGKKTPVPADQQPRQDSSAGRKMMSLEEVEAMMREQSRPTPPEQDSERQAQGLRDMLGLGGPAPPPQEQPRPMQILQRPHQPQQPPQGSYIRADILQRHQSPLPPGPHSQDLGHPPHPTHMQQQRPPPPRAPAVQSLRGPPHRQHDISHQRGPSYTGPPITEAHQMQQMSPSTRAAYLSEEAARAKRNHKIFLLSKNNGLMTPQDKNFITRIQLQQLLTATGGVDSEVGSDQQMAEDFYYQVYSQIRAGGPGQPMNSSQFAQTTHEAARARPKNKSLALEGSLGKIAFSNYKTPRPLLNLKRPDSEAKMRPPTAKVGGVTFDRKAALRDIEKMYTMLMRLEDHERKLPPPPQEDSPPEVIEGHMRWRAEMQELNRGLWASLRILSHGKGKKAIPRVFRHLDDQQRLTMLTLIVIHLDILDVIRDAHPPADNTPLPARVKEEIELFGQAVMPPLFSYVNEAPLNIIVGLLGLVLDRVHVQSVVRTKIGVGMLTMLVSRAELVKQQPANPTNTHQQQQEEDRHQYATLYTTLFDTLEPVLPYLFPTDTTLAASDDVHVWQFLAAMGVGASPEDQQQRLVLGVKERVMETVAVSRGLPEEMRERRLGEVNLFMRAIGLDVELLG